MTGEEEVSLMRSSDNQQSDSRAEAVVNNRPIPALDSSGDPNMKNEEKCNTNSNQTSHQGEGHSVLSSTSSDQNSLTDKERTMSTEEEVGSKKDAIKEKKAKDDKPAVRPKMFGVLRPEEEALLKASQDGNLEQVRTLFRQHKKIKIDCLDDVSGSFQLVLLFRKWK